MSLYAVVRKGKKSSSQKIEMVDWISTTVKNTIQFVGFAKKLKSVIRSKLSNDMANKIHILMSHLIPLRVFKSKR
jgi:hypothetical protein